MNSLFISNLKKNFYQNGNKISVLKGIHLEVKQSKSVALIGESGSGKSTLLSLLCGLDKPDEGEIVLNSKNLTQMNQSEWTEFRGKSIGVVFQQFHLVPHLSALENVMLPLEIQKVPHALEKSKDFLEKVGLSHRLTHMPSQLSGGECQRVALARAFVIQPTFLLADEPSGNLDSKTGEKIIDLMFSLIKEQGILALIVTHNVELANRCEEKYKLKDGVLEKH